MVHHGNAKDRRSRILLRNSGCDEKQKVGENLSRMSRCPNAQTYERCLLLRLSLIYKFKNKKYNEQRKYIYIYIY